MLIRTTRNCPWNRCKFCRTYKGQKFELRTVAEIKQDITMAKTIRDRVSEPGWRSGMGNRPRQTAAAVYNNPPNESFRNVALWLYAGGTGVFLQDADTLIMRTKELAEVIRHLKETFPSIERITSYGRSHTAAHKKPEELIELREVGLSRLHLGLETGYDPLLAYMDKGVTAQEHIAGGRRIVDSGISLSEYVILGLGGKGLWREHATHTARVLNEIGPDFIRVRTLTVTMSMLLHDEVAAGGFMRAEDESILTEERLLIKGLNCPTSYVSDHITNLLPEVEGRLPEEKERMLAIIDRFQALSPQERTNFKFGRRLGLYNRLDDLNDMHRHETVDQYLLKLGQDRTERTLFFLMEGFI